MSSPAPTCRFDPQQKSNQTGLRFSDAQRDEAYLRAKPFLLEQKRILIEDHGWICGDRNDSDEIFLDINNPGKASTKGPQPREKKLNNFILPSTFNHFLDTSKANVWRKIFENPAIFKAERQSGNNHDLYINSSPPLSNIFYLLQVLAPGMLVISVNADVKVSRILPRAKWIQRNRHMLREVMENTDALLTAAKDQNIAEKTARPRSSTSSQNRRASAKDQKSAFLGKRTTRPRYTSSHRDSEFTNDYISDMGVGGEYDWTACDKDCAWCGRCWGDQWQWGQFLHEL